MIGLGVDSLGEYQMVDATWDQFGSTLQFSKVYTRDSIEGGIPKHHYTGVIYPFGIGGCFSYDAEAGTQRKLGYWFMGRPKAYCPGY
jgi:hypothetical protein